MGILDTSSDRAAQPSTPATQRRIGGQVSIKSSGLWCNLCNKPILDPPYWDIGISITLNGTKLTKPGHACKACYEKHGPKKNEIAN